MKFLEKLGLESKGETFIRIQTELLGEESRLKREIATHKVKIFGSADSKVAIAEDDYNLSPIEKQLNKLLKELKGVQEKLTLMAEKENQDSRSN